ncbi:tetratricopeptide repeat protein, partial [Mariniblastus sp.]|nr:tetratricopeptide repeat protein [Mariniblastus sp.]
MNNEHFLKINMPWQFKFLSRLLRALILVLVVFSVTLISLDRLHAAPIQDESAAMKIAQIASAAQNGDDFEFAAEQWETLIKEHPTSKLIGKAHYNAGVCYLKLEQPTQAIPQFKASLEKLTVAETTKKPLAMLYLGFTQFQAGQNLADESKSKESNKLYREAVKTFTDLLKENPEFENADQAFFFQGNALEALGDRKKALATYSKILKLSEPAFKLESLFAVADLHDQLQQY